MKLIPLVIASVLACGALAQTFEPPTPEELAAREAVRPAVDAIWREARTPPERNAPDRPFYFFEVTESLIALGPGAVPFLIAEIDLEDSQTFHFSAYALGRLGGPGAEEALRKAVRRADDRGGRFGASCKRMALYGLALLGKPDVVDLAQEGEEVASAVVIPDLYLMPHLALLLGSEAVPRLLKQVETFADDPAAGTKLEWALRGLGRAGDPSVVPKILPLLASESIGVRAAAEEAVGRLADGSVCGQLTPLLKNSKLRENQVVATALARIRPEGCIPALLTHLETETSVEVRGQIYHAIAAVQGEAALETLQRYMGTTNPYEPTILIDTIRRIGSRKGLPMVRAMLPSKDGAAVQRAIETLAGLGGEGAVDTLLAISGDPRRTVRLIACRNLTALRETRAGPRIAGNLLELVREPVGNLSQRAPIREYADALVTLRFTEPIPELTEAIGKQTDPQIVSDLTSCVSRLKLIAELANDATKWAAKLADPAEPVRVLALDRLAQIGSPAAVAAIARRLDDPKVSPEERAAALRSIGEFHPADAVPVVERYLSDPAYDGFAFRDARFAAAWAARRIGGPKMLQALKDSALRRDGRDFATLVYWGAADPAGARDTIKTLRSRRVRVPESRFGREDEYLDEMLREMARGRFAHRFDVHPEMLLMQ